MSSKPHEVESDVDDDADQQQQLAEITASIIAMAQLDFSSPPPTRGNGPLDAVAVGLLALSEELQASMLAQRIAEEANEARLDGRTLKFACVRFTRFLIISGKTSQREGLDPNPPLCWCRFLYNDFLDVFQTLKV